MKKFFVFIMFLLSVTACGCQLLGDGTEDTPEWKIRNYRIWKGTPAEELAAAVKNQNTKMIEKLCRETPELIDYQEPRYGATLLIWAVGVEKYNAAETLLKCGADPNIATTRAGETALYIASGFSWVDTQAKKDAKYVKLLLSYGADPNLCYLGGDPNNNSTAQGTSPLMKSIGCGIEKTKALVEGGADISHKTSEGETAALLAIWTGDLSMGGDSMEYAHYLIAEKQADVTQPFVWTTPDGQYREKSLVSYMRNWIPKLDSKWYQVKMEIIDEFTRQGEDYWSTEIPKERLDQIQKLYPDTWHEYIEKY